MTGCRNCVERRRWPVWAGAAALAIVGGRPCEAAAPPLAWTASLPGNYSPDVSWAPGGGAYVATTFGVDQAALTRYDGLGATRWRRELPASTRGQTAATDALGNAYLAGETYTALHGPRLGTGDAYLRKYTPDGNLLWGQQFGTAQFDWPIGLTLDGAGNAYVASGPWATNYSVPPAGTLTQVRRFTPSGGLDWLRGVDPGDGTYPGGTTYSSNAAAVSSDGFLYVAFGNYSLPAPNTIDGSSYLAKLSLDGTVAWVQEFMPNQGSVFDVEVDSHNNVYVASAAGLTKFDGAGQLLWRRNTTQVLYSLAKGPQDRMFVGGWSELAPYLAEYDADGVLQWSETLPKASNEWTWYMGLTVSGSKLIGSAHVTFDGYATGTMLRAYQLVPEPGGALLAGLGSAVGVDRVRRRRRSAAAAASRAR